MDRDKEADEIIKRLQRPLPRRFTANWNSFPQDVDVEAEIYAALSQEIVDQIDKEIIDEWTKLIPMTNAKPTE